MGPRMVPYLKDASISTTVSFNEMKFLRVGTIQSGKIPP